LGELKNDVPLDTHVISSFRALKTWKPTSSIIFSVSQTLKHPCVNKRLDFTLIHTFAKDVMSNKGMYILLNAHASRLLNNEVQNGGGTIGWARRYFKHCSCT
jgi:hypothetical protein